MYRQMLEMARLGEEKEEDQIKDGWQEGHGYAFKNTKERATKLIPRHRDLSYEEILKLKFRQYPAMHTNRMLYHCTTLQYTHNI